MQAFLLDTPPRTDATPINIQPSDPTLGGADPEPDLDFNVGALFKPAIGGSVMFNEYPATNPPNDLSDEVYQSSQITSRVQTSLTNHANLINTGGHTTDSDGNWVVTWTEPGGGIKFNTVPDYDLYWAFNSCNVSDLMIIATVNPSNRSLIKISYSGNITDLYDFNQTSTILPPDLDIVGSFNRAGLDVQAGYNSVAVAGQPAAGHIFKTKVDFNESRDDLTFTFY